MKFLTLRYETNELNNSRRIRHQNDAANGRKPLTMIQLPAVPQKPAKATVAWAKHKENDPDAIDGKHPFRMGAETIGRKCGKNKDRMGLVTTNIFAALIMVDGFGTTGDSIATKLRDNLAMTLFEMQHSLIRDRTLEEVLIGAVEKLTPTSQEHGRNGASATVVTVFPDGSFSYSRVGNCPIYLIDKNSTVSRLGAAEKIRIENGTEQKTYDPTSLDPEKYFGNDQNLITCVKGNSLQVSEIDAGGAVLSRGDRLVVVSSGLVRNLPVIVQDEKIGDSRRIFEIFDLADNASPIDQIVEKLVGIEVSERETRRAVGNRLYRTVDKDRSAIGIEFLGQ